MARESKWRDPADRRERARAAKRIRPYLYGDEWLVFMRNRGDIVRLDESSPRQVLVSCTRSRSEMSAADLGVYDGACQSLPEAWLALEEFWMSKV